MLTELEQRLPRRTLDYLDHGAQRGDRNNELFLAAEQFRDAGFYFHEAHGYLMPRAVADGLSEAEARATINSAYSRQPRPPCSKTKPDLNGAEPFYAEQKAPPKPPPEPKPLPDPIPDGFRVLIETVFEPGEGIGISDTRPNPKGEPKPHAGEVYPREKWLEKINAQPIGELYPNHREGLFFRINPMAPAGSKDEHVTAFRHVLVEFDKDKNGKLIPKPVQYAALVNSGLPLSALIDSGNKSIHGLVKVDASDRAEYDRRRDLVYEYFQHLAIDPQNKNPSRFSRCPSVERNLYDEKGNLSGTARQTLLAINVGTLTFEQWEEKRAEEEAREFERIQTEFYRPRERPFPAPMAAEAFYGLAGDILEIIAPKCEASREAILAQLIVGIGNLTGRAPYTRQAGSHHLNEFAVLVGETGRAGRKGTAWDAIQNLFLTIDALWLSDRVQDGFQSGESIIHAVRDQIIGPIPLNRRRAGQAHKLQTAVIDPGVSDKRLLILEEEFARLLIVGARIGNTLFGILRKAWDAKQWLHNEAKHSPEKATGAHISLIGHITHRELQETLREVENKNGLSNRILWIATKRAQSIPIPEWIDWDKYPDIVGRLHNLVATFKIERQMGWSAEAAKQWKDFYNAIPSGEAGILGPIIARADAHVLRLSMIYAVLDHSALITPEHLQAAIAFWDYCERSAQWAFAEKTGNKMADRIYWALQREPNGMSRQEIRDDVFARNCSKTSLDSALAVLVDSKLAYFKTERASRRSTERWFAISQGR